MEERNYRKEYKERIQYYMFLGFDYKQAKQIVLDEYAIESMK